MYTAQVLPALKNNPDAHLKQEAKFEFGHYAASKYVFHIYIHSHILSIRYVVDMDIDLKQEAKFEFGHYAASKCVHTYIHITHFVFS